MSEDRFTKEDFIYALAMLTDDCELDWIQQVTGLSYDESEKIYEIAWEAQRRAWK